LDVDEYTGSDEDNTSPSLDRTILQQTRQKSRQLRAMIDKPSNPALFRAVNNRILVDSEKISAPDTTLQITALSKICDFLPNLLTNVLDNHIRS
jgi:Fic family protein